MQALAIARPLTLASLFFTTQNIRAPSIVSTTLHVYQPVNEHQKRLVVIDAWAVRRQYAPALW